MVTAWWIEAALAVAGVYAAANNKRPDWATLYFVAAMWLHGWAK